MLTTLTLPRSSVCQPRWATRRTPARETLGAQIGYYARLIGQPLMPWQQLVADVGGEIDPESGRPAYRSVIVTVPRQNGKTTLVLAWELQRAVGWAPFGPQRIVYSAQTGNDARKKLVEDQLPILRPHFKKLGITRALTGMGNEAVVFGNGSRLVLMASGTDAGHGKTVDLAIRDELFADVDDRRAQALTPAMATRRLAQILTLSTAGTDESLALNLAVARGRAAVEAGKTSGVAYFEWSAGLDEDPDDPATWRGCMPALGYTIDESVVADARASGMADGEFRRAFLNQPTRSDDRVIPQTAWDAVCDPSVRPVADVAFAVDVNPERSSGSIVAASGGSVPVVELVEQRPGTGWIVARVRELYDKWGRPAVLVDASGPAGALIGDMQQAGVPVTAVAGRELAYACGGFFDRVVESRVRVRRDAALDAAAAGAAKRQVGDAWAWARKHSSIDVSPLVASSLAVWAAAKGPARSALIDPNTYAPDPVWDDDEE